MKKLILYLFLMVITQPYAGLKYNEINTYDVNYCSDYCYNQNDSDSYQNFDEREEIDSYEYEKYDRDQREEDKYLIF